MTVVATTRLRSARLTVPEFTADVVGEATGTGIPITVEMSDSDPYTELATHRSRNARAAVSGTTKTHGISARLDSTADRVGHLFVITHQDR